MSKKTPAIRLSFFVSGLVHDGSVWLLSPSSLPADQDAAQRLILKPFDSEVASTYESAVRATLATGNVLRHGWSKSRTSESDRLTYAEWDAFCKKVLGVKADSTGRPADFCIERLVMEVEALAAAGLVQIAGPLPDVTRSTPDLGRKKKKPVKRLARRSRATKASDEDEDE